MHCPRTLRPTFLICALALALAACGGDQTPGKGGPGGPGGMPAPEVSVVTVKPGELALSAELPGRLEAVRSAEVRARVAGVVLKRVFAEGSDVQEGQVLFQIDPRPFQAAYDNAVAAQARAEAQRDRTRAEAERARALVGRKLISQQDFDLTQANFRQAEADVAAARATAEMHKLNLALATVRAPISGRIGRALVTEGALVGQGEATPLALVQQLDTVYVNFSQSSTELLALRKALAAGKLKRAGDAAVTLLMEDGSEYPQKGRLLFSDLAVDPNTGSVSLRAQFPNPQRVLLPGMYVRVRLAQAVADNAITVPQRALQRNSQGAYVMLVKDGKVAVQPIEVGEAQGDQWIVQSGLAGGEQVIVEGLQKAPPGTPVKAVPFGAAPAGAPAGAPAVPGK
ncbi:MAG TPA: efflux RND transporter periplasmic adaptor subunit [Moraxellaceae bacterium]|nr:efflux RND transporter periplasmic adaptor subunit [Moraxellaceae bacterium]